jgi:RNA polymerase sigma-70 factor (ECF subfamily)
MFEISADHIADLLRKHNHELQRFLSRRLDCPDTVEDIMQMMFLRLSGYQSENRVENSRAFLFRVAANMATDHLRSQDSRRETLIDADLLEQIQEDTPTPEAVLFSQQQLALLKQAIQELPPKCRDVFLLCKFEHYTYQQAAKQLDITESTVTKHMIKALEHCKSRVFDGSQ